MAAETDTLKEWMKAQNVWHPKLYKVLQAKSIATLEEFGKLSKQEYNDIVKESKFGKPSTLKSVYDNAKPKKKKKKKQPENEDEKQQKEEMSTSSKKKKKAASKTKSKSDKPARQSVKQMMAEYAKQKPTGSGKTNDTVSFVGGVSVEDEENED